MEGDVCSYNKFGFCKHKEKCRRRHFTDECKHLFSCTNIKICFKRHPQSCKNFAYGQCYHGKDCAYKHVEQNENEEQYVIIEKVKQLEKVGHALTRKVLSLQKKMVEVKENYKINEGVKVLEHPERVKDNNKKVETDIPDQFCFNPTSSSSPKGKDTNKEQEVKKDKVKNNEMKENLYSCTKCDYKVKK